MSWEPFWPWGPGGASRAQSDPVDQEKYKNGILPTGTYDGALTTVNTQNGGYMVAVPLFSLPGRAGVDLSLTLTYNILDNCGWGYLVNHTDED